MPAWNSGKWLTGREAVTPALARFMDYVQQHETVWVCRPGRRSRGIGCRRTQTPAADAQAGRSDVRAGQSTSSWALARPRDTVSKSSTAC